MSEESNPKPQAEISIVTNMWIGDTLTNLCEFNNVSKFVFLTVKMRQGPYYDGDGDIIIDGSTFAFGGIYYRVKLDKGEKIITPGEFEIEGDISTLLSEGFGGHFLINDDLRKFYFDHLNRVHNAYINSAVYKVG